MAGFVGDFALASSDEDDDRDGAEERQWQPQQPEPEPREGRAEGSGVHAQLVRRVVTVREQLLSWAPDVAAKLGPSPQCFHCPARISVQQSGAREMQTGGWQWDGAIETEKYILFCIPGFGRGTKVLELGSGLGYLAMRLGSVGATVTATDQQAMLPTLQLNIAKNTSRLAAQAQPVTLDVSTSELEWSSTEHAAALVAASRGGWDLIIGSDCIYLSEAFDPLLQTLQRLVAGSRGRPCRVFLSAEHRTGEHVQVDVNSAAARFFSDREAGRLASFGFRASLVWENPSNASGNRVTCYEMLPV